MKIASLIKLFFTLMSLIIFTACGGGGGGGGGSLGGTSVTTRTAVLFDSIVVGARYDAGSGVTGTTDANGVFKYIEGQNVKFYIGDVFIGEGQPVDKPSGISVVTDKILTPLRLAGAGDDIGHPKALKIVRFLIALDRDHNPDNGIDIDIDRVSGHNLRLLDDNLDLDAIFGNDLTLPTSLNAREHLCQSLHRADCVQYTQDIAHLFGKATQPPKNGFHYYKDPTLVIDGNLSTNNHTQCSAPNNWLQIELPNQTKIHKIVIHNISGQSGRLNGSTLYLRDQNYTGSEDVNSSSALATLNSSMTQTIRPDEVVESQYLLIKGNPNGNNSCLHLSEVEVYGVPPIMPNYIAQFPKQEYKFGLKINTQVDTIVGKVTAINYAHKSLSYSIIGDVPFSIDSNGVIKLTSTINHNQVQSYSFQIAVNDGTNSNTTNATVALLSTNGVRQKRWNNINGSSVNNLLNSTHYQNDAPDEVKIVDDLDMNENRANSFGQVMSAILKPTVSGEYIFAIVGDDGTQLNLNGTKIASKGGWSSYQNWNSAGVSNPIVLNAGEIYSIEAILKEWGGAEHISVGWKRVGAGSFDLIPSSELFVEALNSENVKPKFASHQAQIVLQNAHLIGDTVTTVSAYDSQGDTLSYSIVGNVPFSIDNNGNIKVTASLEVETYSFEVKVTDGTYEVNTTFNIVSNSDTQSLNGFKEIFDTRVEAFKLGDNANELIESFSNYSFEKALDRYKNYFDALPNDTIAVFNQNSYLKDALTSIASDSGLEIFTLKNFNDFLQEYQNHANIEDYYNIFFGYAVQSGSSGIYNDKVFWDGWGAFIGPYSAHRTWSVDDEKLFKEAEASIRSNGTYGTLPLDKIKNFTFYIGEKYQLETAERHTMLKSNGWAFNTAIKNALASGINLKTEPLVDLIRSHDLQLTAINTYLKIKGIEPRPLSELKDLIDSYMTNNGIDTYKDYFIQFASNIEEIKSDHLGENYYVWEIDIYLRKVVGLDKQASLYSMSGFKMAQQTIRLYETKLKTNFWPLLDDDIKKRPWHLYALDQGSEIKGCEWVENRFFADDRQTRIDRINSLGTYINLDESSKDDRLITYSHYSKESWENSDYWLQGSDFHPQFSIPTIIRQGGVCGQQGTLEQHSRSCLGQPTLGRYEPGHRALVSIAIDTEGNYIAKNKQGAFSKAYGGSYLNEPYVNSFDMGIRSSGGERVPGIVNGLSQSSNGFDSTLTKAMTLQKIAVSNPDKTEALLKSAIDYYPTTPAPWYQLALFYADNNQEQKVIDLANEYISRISEIKIEKNTRESVASDSFKTTTWGIVSALIVKNTPNAIDLSLEFIKDKLPKGFILTGYQDMFKLIKKNKKANWKAKSQEVLELLLDNNSLGKSHYGFYGKANNYWDNDSDFIEQMKNIVIDHSTVTQKFKRDILKEFFQDDTALISQIKFKNRDFMILKYIELEDTESNNLYITTSSFSGHVLGNEEGQEGYKIINIEVSDENGAKSTLKVRVSKEFDGKLVNPNDSSGAVDGKTKFVFWIDKSDNNNIPHGIYNANGTVIHHKGHRTNTYYDIGDSILLIDNLELFPTFDEKSYTMNTMKFEFELGAGGETTYNFFNNPAFMDDTKGVNGKTDVNITVVDSDNNEHILRTKMFQDLWNTYFFKADSAGAWNSSNYSYQFNIQVDASENPDLIGKTVSTQNSFVMYKRAWHQDHKVVSKVLIDIVNLEITNE